jgi:response regulator RpfG family c-di-GMP phosphodiesterase
LEVCRAARNCLSAPPHIILVTARDDVTDKIRGLESGADDYITKPFANEEFRARLRVGARIVELRSKLQKRIAELEDARQHIRVLQGLLPICMHCHRIRQDDGIWQQLEAYVRDHSEADFSHGICPECRDHYYGDRLKRHRDKGQA